MVLREAKNRIAPLVLQLSNRNAAIANFYSSRIALSRFFFIFVYWVTGFQLVTFLIKFLHSLDPYNAR